MDSFSELVRAFPTRSVLAKGCGVDYVVAQQWNVRDSIPPEYWPDVLRTAAANEIQLTVDDLVRWAARKRKVKPDASPGTPSRAPDPAGPAGGPAGVDSALHVLTPPNEPGASLSREPGSGGAPGVVDGGAAALPVAVAAGEAAP